jgi:GxxExxY protein
VTLGPGLLESAYERCLTYELKTRHIHGERQVVVPIIYRGNRIEAGFRIDIIVADLVLVEVTAIEQIARVHEAQLVTYLKLAGYTLGLLINFNVPLIKHGIRRRICSSPLAPLPAARDASPL